MSSDLSRGPGDVLRVADLDPLHLYQVLNLASRMRATPAAWVNALHGLSVACFFEQPAMRTRVSFQAAAFRLGMQPIMLRPDTFQLGSREPIADSARVLSSYAAAIVIRTFTQQSLEEVAEAAEAPVINALSDTHHPCQALADLLTLRDHFGHLDGLRLAFVGADSVVVHSLLEAGALAGMHIVVATPEQYAPPRLIVEQAAELAVAHGGSIIVTNDPFAAVQGADAVYTDEWVTPGAEKLRRERGTLLRPFQVNERLMAQAGPQAIFLHCLPAHRGQEVSGGVIDGPSSLVWKQAANRLPTEQALLYLLITDDWSPPRRHIHEG